MRHVMLTLLLALAIIGIRAGIASATAFEPATIPDRVQAVGHLDVDALRKTQIFQVVGGQAALDAALEDAPAALRPVARTLIRTARGVSFWRDTDHGAVYLETRDSRALAQLIAKLPAKPARVVDGCSTYTMEDDDRTGYLAAYGDTLVLADSDDSLERSLRVLAGKAPNLAGSSKLPLSTRQGVFVFVTIGDNLLGAIQKAAHSKVLQLGLRSLVVDIGETNGMVTANARAEMRTADAVLKAKSIVEGLHALASLSDDPAASKLLDDVTVTTSGLAVEVAAKLSVAEIAQVIQSTKHSGRHRHHE